MLYSDGRAGWRVAEDRLIDLHVGAFVWRILGCPASEGELPMLSSAAVADLVAQDPELPTGTAGTQWRQWWREVVRVHRSHTLAEGAPRVTWFDPPDFASLGSLPDLQQLVVLCYPAAVDWYHKVGDPDYTDATTPSWVELQDLAMRVKAVTDGPTHIVLETIAQCDNPGFISLGPGRAVVWGGMLGTDEGRRVVAQTLIPVETLDEAALSPLPRYADVGDGPRVSAARRAAARAEVAARCFGDEQVNSGHILLALLDEDEFTRRALSKHDVSEERVREEMSQRSTSGHRGDTPLRFNSEARSVLARSLHVRPLSRPEDVQPHDILLSLLQDSETARAVLLSLGVGPEQLHKEVVAALGRGSDTA